MFTEKEQFVLDTVASGVKHSSYADVDRSWVAITWARKYAPINPAERYGTGQPEFVSITNKLLDMGALKKRNQNSKTFFSVVSAN